MMGGSSVIDDWELPLSCNNVRTLVVVGRNGNGKSATGNTILGRKAFKSRASSSGVTSTCELQSTVLEDGQIINVIDTPGLFDISVGMDFFCKEIVRCIDLANDGIHAVLVILSVRTRFSEEEEASIRSLRILFGSKIVNCMIVVFTGGDELDENDTLEDYLGRECPRPLKDILEMCENRMVLFDNKIKDGSKRIAQVSELLSFVNMVINQNDGKPFSDELFAEMKKGALKLREQHETLGSSKGYNQGESILLNAQMQRSYEDQMKRLTDMVEAKLKESTTKLQHELTEEQAARRQVEQRAKEEQKKSEDKIRSLTKSLKKAQEQKETITNKEGQKKKDEFCNSRGSLKRTQEEKDNIRRQAAERGCTIL